MQHVFFASLTPGATDIFSYESTPDAIMLVFRLSVITNLVNNRLFRFQLLCHAPNDLQHRVVRESNAAHADIRGSCRNPRFATQGPAADTWKMNGGLDVKLTVDERDEFIFLRL